MESQIPAIKQSEERESVGVFTVAQSHNFTASYKKRIRPEAMACLRTQFVAPHAPTDVMLAARLTQIPQVIA